MGEVQTTAGVGLDEVEAWKHGEEHREYWLKNHKRLARQYPAQYVAVKAGQVVAHSPSLHALVGFLEGRGLDPREVLLEYMAVNPASMLPR
jgi:hypothetical protein